MPKVSVKIAPKIDAENAYNVEVLEEYEDKPTSFTVHTNRQGRGLWIDGKQVEGTGQFDLHVKDKAAKIRRYFQNV